MGAVTEPTQIADTARVADMAPLIVRLREYIAERADHVTVQQAPFDATGLRERFGFADGGGPQMILAQDAYAELGHPSTASAAIVLVTHDENLVADGRCLRIGPDLDGIAKDARAPYGQVVLVAVGQDEAFDPFDLENAQYLTHRLPGYMVRSVPGRLWVRIGAQQARAGLDLDVVASALMASYRGRFDAVAAVEVVHVTSSAEDVQALSAIGTEASILWGHHKKLALGADGEVECSDLNCDDCDEQEVCDNLRDVIVKRRRRRRE